MLLLALLRPGELDTRGEQAQQQSRSEHPDVVFVHLVVEAGIAPLIGAGHPVDIKGRTVREDDAVPHDEHPRLTIGHAVVVGAAGVLARTGARHDEGRAAPPTAPPALPPQAVSDNRAAASVQREIPAASRSTAHQPPPAIRGIHARPRLNGASPSLAAKTRPPLDYPSVSAMAFRSAA